MYQTDLTETEWQYITIQVMISSYKEQGFRPIHKRWIVERTFSWLDNNGRLCRKDELIFDFVLAPFHPFL